MTLNYDIDFFSIFPEEIFSSDGTGDFLKEIGFQSDQAQNKVAMFRDPKTLQALQNAPENVRAFVTEIGIGMNVYDSGAPIGRYLASDEQYREPIFHKFFVSMALPEVKAMLETDVPEGEFSLSDFWNYNLEAKPIEGPTPSSVTQSEKPGLMDKLGIELTGSPEQQRKTKQTYLGLAAGGVALLLWYLSR